MSVDRGNVKKDMGLKLGESIESVGDFGNFVVEAEKGSQELVTGLVKDVGRVKVGADVERLYVVEVVVEVVDVEVGPDVEGLCVVEVIVEVVCVDVEVEADVEGPDEVEVVVEVVGVDVLDIGRCCSVGGNIRLFS